MSEKVIAAVGPQATICIQREEISRLQSLIANHEENAAELKDWSDKLYACLVYWKEHCTGREPSISVFNRMVDDLIPTGEDNDS